MRACTTRQRPPTTTPFGADSDDGRTSRPPQRGRRTRATQQKPLCVGGALERSLDRSFAGSSLVSPQRARRARTTTARRHDNKRHDKNAAAASVARARETHSSHCSSPTSHHHHHHHQHHHHQQLLQ
uniref:Uncharacterized protein n=1 Tax=Schizaphis graminum TaxID=13262 RepID=A0A2S2NBG6_SCHGA